MKHQLKLNKLSKHLFWDVDISSLDADKNKKLIIQRVLDYGLLEDWQMIYDYYGIDKIANAMLNIKDLDKKSLNFISVLSDIPKEKFLCYTTKQSSLQHWVY